MIKASSCISRAKSVVLSHYGLLDASTPEGLPEALSGHTGADCTFSFTHPFKAAVGAEAAAKNFWSRIRKSFSPLQRRQDIFFAGQNHLSPDPEIWVVSMGHLLGLFEKPFLGIRPTRQSVMLRYAEFNLVAGDKITESTIFLDVMNLMMQARAEVYQPSTAATIVTPGPRTHDGLLFGNQPEEEGQATLKLFVRMIDRLLSEDVKTTRTDLSLDWTDDMIWWGPGGIGAPYTQECYLKQHCVPFEKGLEWGEFFGHRTEFAEGCYGGFFGWPTFDVKSRGGYIGLAPKSDKKASMRVVDLYRREGDKLAENWNFIDHLDFLAQLGVDLIERQRQITGF
ncbi:MAG: hypothetical protein V6Z81_10415 [Parvularculales bacterium]